MELGPKNHVWYGFWTLIPYWQSKWTLWVIVPTAGSVKRTYFGAIWAPGVQFVFATPAGLFRVQARAGQVPMLGGHSVASTSTQHCNKHWLLCDRGSKYPLFEVSDSKKSYSSWLLEPETSNIGCLDPLGGTGPSVLEQGYRSTYSDILYCGGLNTQ